MTNIFSSLSLAIPVYRIRHTVFGRLRKPCVGLCFITCYLCWVLNTQAKGLGPLKYANNRTHVAITDCSTTAKGEVVIPAEIEETPVTVIASQAFESCASITSISIPVTVVSIGDGAFNGCRLLKSITLPEGLTSIGSHAFGNCTFLENISIPASVTTIGISPFFWCDSLPEIAVHPNNPNFFSIEGVLFDSKNHTLIAYPSGKTTKDYSVPVGTVSIGESAFFWPEHLLSVTLPDGVSTIGDYAFNFCRNLQSISIPESVTSIGVTAFGECESLKRISLPTNLKSISDGMLSNCRSLFRITVPVGVTSIGNFAFGACTALRQIDLPGSITSIGRTAFGSCPSLVDITLPEGITSIREHTFYECISLANIVIPKSVTSIEAKAFKGCESLTSLSIPKSVKFIGDDALNVVRDGGYTKNSLEWISIPAAFHTELEARRLGIGRIYPKYVYLPDFKPFSLIIRLVPELTLEVTRNGPLTTYTIEVADSLLGPWSFWGTATLASGSTIKIKIEPTDESRFYRIAE